MLPRWGLRRPRDGQVNEPPGARQKLGAILDLGAPLHRHAGGAALKLGPEDVKGKLYEKGHELWLAVYLTEAAHRFDWKRLWHL